MSNETIARAIVYAARQALYINDYGMSWESIEVNTANILAGCSVPADGKMNSAEAVSNSIMGRLRTQADTPPNRNMIGSHPLPWTLRRVTIPSWRGPGLPRATRHELMHDNGRIVGNIRNERVAHEMVRLVNSGGAVALELVDKYHEHKNELARTKEALRIEATAAQAARNDLAQLRGDWTEVIAERSQARLERDLALKAVRIATTAAQESRKEALANKAERDETRLEQDKYVRNLENLVDAERQRVADQDSHILTRCRERDEARAERDAQATERNAADAKVVKLRTFLERGLANPWEFSDNALKYLLEETK